MKDLGRILVLCGALTLASAAGTAGAFEVEGASAVNPTTLGIQPNLEPGEFKPYSLATPLTGSVDNGSATILSYGNSIAIPAPGVDLPTPAWATSPTMGTALGLR
jgi:hypothetical protein